LIAWVVGRIDVGDRPRTAPVQLQDRLPLHPSEMSHPHGPVAERASRHGPGRRPIEPVAHAEVKSPSDYRDMLDLRVPVRSHYETVRETHPQRKHSLLARITLQDRHLYALRQRRQALFPGDLSRPEQP